MQQLEKLLKSKIPYLGSYIDGQWCLASNPNVEWEHRSPANTRDWLLAESISVEYEHVNQATDAAVKAQKLWSGKTLDERVAGVRAFGHALEKKSGLLAAMVALESGKPLTECQTEVSLLQKKIAVTIEDALPRLRTESVDVGAKNKAQIVYRPKGVLAVIGPFNFPVHLSHGHIVPALLMGNAVILKPSEKAPLSAQIYVQAAAEALPAGLLQLLQGNAELSTRLIRHPDVNGVLATCSLDVGIKIRHQLSAHPEKILALEMGGKNAAIVMEDADVDQTAKDLIQSSYLSTGQRCTAVSRVYVHRKRREELESKLHHLAKELVIADPFHIDPAPFMGPIISQEARDKFLRYADRAEQEGAEAIMRPKALSGTPRMLKTVLPEGYYVSPSLYRVDKHRPNSAYQSHEIFGPDLFTCAMDSFEEGISYVNDSAYGLVACVFGGSPELFSQIADNIHCGLVYHNRPSTGASGKLPFGGWKGSGNHRPAGLFAIYSSCQAQARIV